MSRKITKSTRPAKKRTESRRPEATVHGWAVALGKNEKTLQGLFTRAGIALPKPGEVVSAKTMFFVLFGDEYSEKLRILKAQADRKEREGRVAIGELVPISELEPKIVEIYIVPMSNIFAGMAAAIDTRCNPDNPKIARQAIEAYIESTVKPALRSGLEKPRKETK